MFRKKLSFLASCLFLLWVSLLAQSAVHSFIGHADEDHHHHCDALHDHPSAAADFAEADADQNQVAEHHLPCDICKLLAQIVHLGKPAKLLVSFSFFHDLLSSLPAPNLCGLIAAVPCNRGPPELR